MSSQDSEKISTQDVLNEIEQLNNKKINKQSINTENSVPKKQIREVKDIEMEKNNNNADSGEIEDINSLKKFVLKRAGIKTREKESSMEWWLYGSVWLIFFFFSYSPYLYLGYFWYRYVIDPFLFSAPQVVIVWDTGFLDWVPELGNGFMEFLGIFHQPRSMLVFLSTPLILLLIHVISLFSSAFIAKIMYGLFNLTKKRKVLINAAPRGKTADDVNIYHTRGFLLRLIKWRFSKSFFPWSTVWMFNFVGANKISKKAVIEDSFYCQEFLEMEDNAYIGYKCIVSSHLVEGIYGQLTVKPVKIGKNSVLGNFNLVSPGVELLEDSELLPLGVFFKFKKTTPHSSYWGVPAKKLPNKIYDSLLNINIEKIEKINKNEEMDTN